MDVHDLIAHPGANQRREDSGRRELQPPAGAEQDDLGIERQQRREMVGGECLGR